MSRDVDWTSLAWFDVTALHWRTTLRYGADRA
jgi:hypothetical protein